MTRIVIFGDLHANWEALLALQQAELRPQPRRVDTRQLFACDACFVLAREDRR